jgi:enoyl-CoA hydratase
VNEAIHVAALAASRSRPVAMMIKECVNRTYETSLAEALRFERRALRAAFSLNDRKEGHGRFHREATACILHHMRRTERG